MKTVIEHDEAVTLAELIERLQAIAGYAVDPDITYLSIGGEATSTIGVNLVETTLSDGSKVLDVNLARCLETHQREESRVAVTQYATAAKLIRIKTVKQITGLDRRDVYHRIEIGTFPPGIDIGGQRNAGWWRQEVLAWRRAYERCYSDEQMRKLVETLVRERRAVGS